MDFQSARRIGFARVCSEALYKGQPAMRWVDFKGGGNIQIQWISKCLLPLKSTEHIKNPFNKGICCAVCFLKMDVKQPYCTFF